MLLAIGIIFGVAWLWIIYEMYVAPHHNELWGEDGFGITDEDVLDDLNHGTEVTKTDDHS